MREPTDQELIEFNDKFERELNRLMCKREFDSRKATPAAVRVVFNDLVKKLEKPG